MNTIKLNNERTKLLLVEGYEVDNPEIQGELKREKEYLIYLEVGNSLYVLPTQFCSRLVCGIFQSGSDRALSMINKIKDKGHVCLSAWVPTEHDCHTMNGVVV